MGALPFCKKKGGTSRFQLHSYTEPPFNSRVCPHFVHARIRILFTYMPPFCSHAYPHFVQFCRSAQRSRRTAPKHPHFVTLHLSENAEKPNEQDIVKLWSAACCSVHPKHPTTCAGCERLCCGQVANMRRRVGSLSVTCMHNMMMHHTPQRTGIMSVPPTNDD